MIAHAKRAVEFLTMFDSLILTEFFSLDMYDFFKKLSFFSRTKSFLYFSKSDASASIFSGTFPSE